MRKLCLCLLIVVAGCLTREVPAKQPTPPAIAQHHIAMALILVATPAAKCEAVIETAAYDSATCAMPDGQVLYCWHSMTEGMRCFTLAVPEQKSAQAPAAAPAGPPSSVPPGQSTLGAAVTPATAPASPHPDAKKK